MNQLRTYLESYLAISDEDWSVISQHLREGACEKSEQLTCNQQIENRVYFLLDGVVRLFFEGVDKDTTLNFGFPNQFISSYSSFLTGAPSIFIIEALTTCSFIYLEKESIEELYRSTACGLELGKIFADNMFLYLSKRENDFVLHSPEERYLNLFKEQPVWMQEIPQKYLASYIGITPQALSRIRARLAKSD